MVFGRVYMGKKGIDTMIGRRNGLHGRRGTRHPTTMRACASRNGKFGSPNVIKAATVCQSRV